MKFGDRLAEIRKQKKLTQDQLGAGLGTDGTDSSKAVVLGWEKNRHFPRVDQLILICDKLGVGADYLLFGKVDSSDLSPELKEIAAAFGKLSKHQIAWAMRAIRTTLEAAPFVPEPDADRQEELKVQDFSSSRRAVM